VSEPVFQPALPLADLPAGRMQVCRLAGREILVCHTRDGVFAVDNLCTHADARMSEGWLRGTRLVCPLHGACFDLRDGLVLAPPATRALATHAVRITAGMIEVALNPSAPPIVRY
jgi:3-phenylpropionate/trans-cinnamate dioxygenase ferredoxin subunit